MHSDVRCEEEVQSHNTAAKIAGRSRLQVDVLQSRLQVDVV